mgnify:CR=1 FL=1
MIRKALFVGTALLLSLAGSAARADTPACDRACMTRMVDAVIGSMVTHDPERLPMAPLYAATENSHPAALSMMQAWRTITDVGAPTRGLARHFSSSLCAKPAILRSCGAVSR